MRDRRTTAGEANALRTAARALVLHGVAWTALTGCGSSSTASSGPPGGPDSSSASDAEAPPSTTSGDDAAGGPDAVGPATNDATTSASTDGSPGDASTSGSIVGDATGVTAAPASAFLGSIGLCVHIAQGVDSAQSTATALAYAGVRNLRDDGRPTAVADWITVYRQSGARTNMLPNGD